MACDPNTLLEQAKCYQCALTGDLFPAVEIVLLCAWRDGTPLSCDPQSLMSEANCIRSCIPLGMMSAVKLSILCDIASGTTCSDPEAPSGLAAIMGPGSLLDFDGIAAHVVVPNSASLQITTALTFEAWVDARDIAANGIFEKTIGGATNTSFSVFLFANLLIFRLVKGAALIETTSDMGFPLNTLTHVAATWDGATMRMYINGVPQVATTALTAPIDTGAGTSLIGILGTGFAVPFNGQIDEVRVWNVARTLAEIVDGKDRALVGTEPGLAAYWRLDENGGLSAFDSTVNGNTGTLTAGPTWVASSIFPAQQATVSWTDNATNETSYELQYRNLTQGGSFVSEPPLPADSTETVITILGGAMDLDQIEIQVRAVNGTCASAWVTTTVTAHIQN